MRWDNERGEEIVVYSLVIAAIAIAIVLALTVLGSQVNGWFLQLVR